MKFSPKRIILDNRLETKKNSYIFKTASNNNTVIFYKNAKKHKINYFKKKGIKLIRSDLYGNRYFNLKMILKKLYKQGCRNLLVEGGNQLTGNFLKKNLFNQFYLFKSKKNLSKLVIYKDFKFIKDLTQNYKNKSNVQINLGKDIVTRYRKRNV